MNIRKASRALYSAMASQICSWTLTTPSHNPVSVIRALCSCITSCRTTSLPWPLALGCLDLVFEVFLLGLSNSPGLYSEYLRKCASLHFPPLLFCFRCTNLSQVHFSCNISYATFQFLPNQPRRLTISSLTFESSFS